MPMLADLSQNNVSQNDVSQLPAQAPAQAQAQALATAQPTQTTDTAIGSSTERFTELQPQNSQIAMVPQTRAQDPNDSDLPTSIAELTMEQKYTHSTELIDYSREELLRQNDKSLGE